MTDTVWRVARAVLALGLAALLLFGVGRAPDPGERVRIDASTTAEELAALLVADGAAALTYADSAPPTRAVAALLASAAAGGARVVLAVPGGAERLRVVPPARPVVGRRAALGVHVRGEPAGSVPVVVTGQSGAADTVVVPIGPDGRGAASVALEPSRAGAATWTVRTQEAEATVHAWVRPESPVRVLVWSGAPGWESRWLVRALEATGMEVSVRQDLGREMVVTTDGADAPRTVEDLAVYDVLAVVGAAADSARALALPWVEERGGGLLVTGLAGADREVAATDLSWAGPVEIVPLPPTELVVRAAPAPGPGMVVAAAGGEAAGGATTAATAVDPSRAVLARAAHLGRGRLFASGLETWSWAMEAGLAEEHQAYWASVVEWLAGGLRDDALLRAGAAQPWVRWEGRLEGAVPDAVILRRPAAAAANGPTHAATAASAAATPTPPGPEILPLALGGATFSFVPTTEGGHTLALAGAPSANPEGGGGVQSDFGVVAAPPEERLP